MENIVVDVISAKEANDHFFHYKNHRNLLRVLKDQRDMQPLSVMFGRQTAIDLKRLKAKFPNVEYEIDTTGKNPVSIRDFYSTHELREKFGISNFTYFLSTIDYRDPEDLIVFENRQGIRKSLIDGYYMTVKDQIEEQVMAMNLSPRDRKPFKRGALFTGDINKELDIMEEAERSTRERYLFVRGYLHEFTIKMRYLDGK